MDENILQRARQTLVSYLEENHCRKTPERFAILDTIYAMDGHFTLEELGERMEQDNFRVSRATLYNAINLFLRLRLVVRHNFQQLTRYEACFHNDNHCHQICTVCGKVSEVASAPFANAMEEVKLKRFHPTGYSLYIYGLCSSCQAKAKRKRNKAKTNTNTNTNTNNNHNTSKK